MELSPVPRVLFKILQDCFSVDEGLIFLEFFHCITEVILIEVSLLNLEEVLFIFSAFF